ncbi:MAG: helix-turn-helix transcriptional regulator [Syntrophomonadaceae bacterium]
MFFSFKYRNKTVKELRKNRGYTVKELAARLKIDPSRIFRIDNMKLKEVPKPLHSKLLPILRGDEVEKIPWL